MEKRKLSRVLFTTTAQVSCDGKVFPGEVKNLSLKGMFIGTTEPLSIGSTIVVTLNLAVAMPDVGNIIKVTGRVVRKSEAGVGVLFEETDLDSFTHLRNIVAYNLGDDDWVMEEYFKAINKED